MAKTKPESQNSEQKSRPPQSQEARDAMMISLAYDAAEKQIREGTASSQVITHFLKLGSEKVRMETEKLALERDLVVAKTEKMKSDQRAEERFEAVIKAMRKYNGDLNHDDDEEEFY